MPLIGRRIAALAAVALVAAGVLSGCAGQDPQRTTTPKPSATPLYPSEKEALAAAKVAYAKYVEVSNQVAQEGWVDLTPLKTVATGDALNADTRSGNSNREKGLRVEGDISGDVVKLQSIQASSVSAYACLDVTATRILDKSGTDQTSPNRTDIIPFEVKFVSSTRDLLVGRVDVWSGQSFC